MRWLRSTLLAGALLASCGSPEAIDATDRPVPEPSTVRSASELRGPLPFLVVRVSYADEPTPFSSDSVLELGTLLDRFIVRNSTGAAYVRTSFRDVVLPGTSASYSEASTQAVLDQGGPLFPVQQDCLRFVPDPTPYRLFLLPGRGPVVNVGYGTTRREPRYAWVSGLEFAPGDVVNLPIPHEVGHMLGLGHAAEGTMLPTSAGSAREWEEGFFAAWQRHSLGWI